MFGIKVVRDNSILQNVHLVSKGVLVGEVCLLRIFLVQFYEGLVDDYSGTCPKGFHEKRNYIVKSVGYVGLGNSLLFQKVIDNVSDRASHSFKRSVEATVEGFMEHCY